jgi:hypothetical protein
LITSDDGLQDWRSAKHGLVSSRRYIDAQGTEFSLTHMERPQLLFNNDGQIQCLFVAASHNNPFKGAPTFNLHFPIH